MADSNEKLKTAQQFMDFLKDDWGKLPNSFKFCFTSGLLLIGATWLIKPSGYVPQFSLFHHSYFVTLQSASFLVFTVLVIIVPIVLWLAVQVKILYYRRRYPLKKVGTQEGFLFQQIHDAVFLIDRKRKKIYWLESAKTAYDLGYYSSMWFDMIQRSKTIQAVVNGDKGINIDDFHLGHGIRTRGEPRK